VRLHRPAEERGEVHWVRRTLRQQDLGQDLQRALLPPRRGTGIQIIIIPYLLIHLYFKTVPNSRRINAKNTFRLVLNIVCTTKISFARFSVDFGPLKYIVIEVFTLIEML